jgi:hypothetical protein
VLFRSPLVLALIQRFVPRRDGFPDPEAIGTARAVDRVLSMVDDSSRMELKQLLMLFENALPAFLFGGRTLPFTRLSVDDQDRVLAEWRDSRITLRRTGLLALRTIIFSAYYADAATWPAVNYPGPPPGVFNPSAPVWKGEGTRPAGNGVFVGPRAEPVDAGPLDAGVVDADGGTP